MKKRAILIAEKPSLLRSLMAAYEHHKEEFDFVIVHSFAQVGHLFGLKLPKELDEDMEKWEMDNYPWHPHHWEYKIMDSSSYKIKKSDIFRDIKKTIHTGGCDFIIHAGDPDQEGELLVRETLMEAGNTLPIKRFWSNAKVEEEFVKGLKNLEDDTLPFYENMYQAALARQHADYLVGMNFSPVVSLRTNETSNIGRLKTLMNYMVTKREEEVNHFVPSSTYSVQADYKEGFSGVHTTFFDTEEEVKNLQKKCLDTAVVTSYETKRERVSAPPLYKLSTLQMQANKKGYSAEQVQGIAQSLYDKGVLSYPRTSCEFLNDKADFVKMLTSAMAFEELTPFIKKITKDDIEAVKKKKMYINNKKVESSGHMALTPTSKKPNLSELSTDEREILFLVYAQYVAIFLPPLIQEKTKIITENNGYEFSTTGKVLIEKGFTELLTTDMKDKPLPKLTKGDKVTVGEFSLVEKKATPPKLFTDGTLIEALEKPLKYMEDEHLKTFSKANEVSIGQPATRVPLLNELLRLKYLEHKKGSGKTEYLIPTDKGRRNAKNMMGNDLTKADTTALWEEKLEQIRQGEISRTDFEKEIWQFVKDNVKDLKSKPMESYSRTSSGESKYACPNCSSVIAKGKFGYYCTKKCGMNLSKVYGKELTEIQITKLLSGKEISYTQKGRKTTVLPHVKKNEWKGRTYYNWATK